jgi:hypothetical protein
MTPNLVEEIKELAERLVEDAVAWRRQRAGVAAERRVQNLQVGTLRTGQGPVD